MSKKVEDFYPGLNDGWNWRGNISVGGTLAVTGAVTFSGAQVGQKVAVTASGGTTRTLTAANSGSVNLFDSAAGIAYTLPATAVGLYYDFFTTVSQTSSAHSIVTPASSFLVGGVNSVVSNSATSKAFFADGAATTTYTTNGTTTGGIIGTWLRVVALTATQWGISGQTAGTGTPATPFA